jgi:hypothetical protein
VALSWGEPVIPWWRHHRHHGQPRWDGWGGPRIVNNVVVKQTTVVKAENIRFHNAKLPRAVLTVPADKFGRAPVRATSETRYRDADFVPVRSELPVKPSRVSLYGGAPRGVQPPKAIFSRAVVSTRTPRERAPALDDALPRARQAVPASRYVVPPERRAGEVRTPARPPFGAEAGPERTPPPRLPRYDEMKKTEPVPPPVSTRSRTTVREQTTVRSQPAARERDVERREARPAQPPAAAPPATLPSAPGSVQPPARLQSVPPPAAPRSPVTVREREASGDAGRREVRPAPGSVPAPPPAKAAPSRDDARQDGKALPLPGQPASQTYRGRDRDTR